MCERYENITSVFFNNDNELMMTSSWVKSRHDKVDEVHHRPAGMKGLDLKHGGLAPSQRTAHCSPTVFLHEQQRQHLELIHAAALVAAAARDSNPISIPGMKNSLGNTPVQGVSPIDSPARPSSPSNRFNWWKNR